MARIVLSIVMTLATLASPVWAQPNPRVEISVNGGYTLSEGIPVNAETVLGLLIDRVTPKSGGSYGILANFFAGEQAQVGFQYSQQFSTFELEPAGGLGGKIDLADMKVRNYHGIFTYNWGFSDSPVRPFFFGGLGATQ